MKHQGQGLPQCLQQRLAKRTCQKIPEAKWEIQNMHNHPCQTALGSGQHSGLNKFNLISYPMTTLKPQKAKIKQVPCWLAMTNLIITVILTKHLRTASAKTRKVKDWRDWTYTDGSLQKNEVGQDTGSGVYHPHLNVSHYENPKGMGITNTISRAELAAIAAAVIHGYSHIATDSLISLHQIKKHLSHPNLHRHHIQADVLQSIAKAIRQITIAHPLLQIKFPCRYYR